MNKIELEIIELIRLGKRTGDMRLKNYARAALFGCLSDDGTYGLGDYLWEEIIYPNLIKARKRASYHYQTQNVVNTARILGMKRKHFVGR